MTIKVRPNSGFDFLTPGSVFIKSGDDFVCLETGEVISPAEYFDWKNSFKESKNLIPKTASSTLHKSLVEVADSLDHLASLCGTSETPISEELNPDMEVGETGVTPLTFGSVENILHPIFSDIPIWEANSTLAEVFRELSRLTELIDFKILQGKQNFEEYKELPSLLRLMGDCLFPSYTTMVFDNNSTTGKALFCFFKDLDHDKLKVEILKQRFAKLKRKAKCLQQALRWQTEQITVLEQQRAKRNALIRTLRRSGKQHKP